MVCPLEAEIKFSAITLCQKIQLYHRWWQGCHLSFWLADSGDDKSCCVQKNSTAHGLRTSDANRTRWHGAIVPRTGSKKQACFQLFSGSCLRIVLLLYFSKIIYFLHFFTSSKSFPATSGPQWVAISPLSLPSRSSALLPIWLEFAFRTAPGNQVPKWEPTNESKTQ